MVVSVPADLQFRATAITDIGRMRRRNEDRFLCEPALNLFGVADGVGGLPSGAQAAQCVVDTLKSQIHRAPLQQLADWEALISAANEQVFQLGQLISPAHGIASTFTGGVINGAELWLAHVGDSRCHLINSAGVTTLTEDHSAENEAKNNPDFPTPTERHRESLVRVMGHPEAARPELSIHALTSGDHLLFATDGITGVISAEELATQVLQPLAPAERLSRIVAETNKRGGPDNATAVLVEARDSSY
ncbi:MAG: serine/threonine-protein phosphatase [Opitutaceae bacterium]|jgi:serine/threonine protein phosphatase PrpC|nr:serine/threonine-protein phosphatase [Opitutaceae bacterium]